jgi:hypothetical protein
MYDPTRTEPPADAEDKAREILAECERKAREWCVPADFILDLWNDYMDWDAVEAALDRLYEEECEREKFEDGGR